MSGFLKNPRLYGPPLLLCLCLVVALFLWHTSLVASGPRAYLAFGLAGFVLWFAFPGRGTLAGADDALGTYDFGSSLDPSYVRNFIAYDAIIFSVVGLATAITAAPQWETAILLSGTCLLIGAFFGLLFGYPQGVAQTATTQSPPESGPPNQKSTTQNVIAAANGVPTENNASAAKDDDKESKDTAAENGAKAQSGTTAGKRAGNGTSQPSTPQKNLIAESASTLGKVIAGFTLARTDIIAQHFRNICHIVGPALGRQQDPHVNAVLAGTVMLYFFATGFFSGLLLPSYFMSGKFG